MARQFDVAVMHDYFVDRLVHVGDMANITETISAKAKAGGGGVHGIVQDEVRGGNAVNLAHALARLGLRTLLITHSDGTNERLLRDAFEGLRAELRVKPLPAGLTVAFEGRVNVMLGDGRGAADFGPSMLDDGDWEAIRNAKVVCSVNWAANRRGTELLVELRRKLGEEKTIFLDPADFRDRVPAFKGLLARMRERRLADWVSMNQEEGKAAAYAMGVRTGELGEICLQLARRLGVVFDLHAEGASYSSEGTRVTEVRTRGAKSRRLTGAGDVWDAGAIYGRLKGMDEKGRLDFANRAARFYLEREELLPPTAEEVASA